MAAKSFSDEEVVKALLVSQKHFQKVLDNLILKYNREYTEEEEGGQIIDIEKMELTYDAKQDDLDVCIIGVSKGLGQAQSMVDSNDLEFTKNLSFFQKVKVENHWEDVQ